MEPNLRRAVELFSQGIKQGSLLTRSGNAQNFSGSRKPFIGSDPVPVNQGRTPIPPSFRPNPVSPGQLGLFDDRIGSQRFRAPSIPPALTGGGSSPSIMDLRNTAGAAGTRAMVGAGLAGAIRSSYLGSVQRNQLGGLLSFPPYAGAYSAAQSFTGGPTSILPVIVDGLQNLKNLVEKRKEDKIGENYTVGGIEYDNKTGRAINPPLNTLIPAQTRLPQGNPPGNNRPDRDPLPQYIPPGNNRPDRSPLPQTTPTDNTMTPASAAFTRFFVDDANRLSPTAMDLATATGGVQTRDLGSLTSGLKAADLESALNSVASAQAMSDSPSFMAGNPLMGTPKLVLNGAREQAVNEQKQQYAKQGAPKGITNEQRDYVLTMQAQQAAGKVLLPEILKNLGYSPQDPATRDLAVWAESNPGLALAVYNKQLEQNLNNRSDFPSPRELSSSDPVNQQSASNVEGTMVNSPMGANLARNAVANSHFNANAYVSGSQEATELADATQPLVQPTLQTAEQFIDQAPERAEATAQISDEMLKRAMELKLGKMSMDPSLLGN